MINIRSIKKLQNNDGLTLKKGKIVTYRTGYQVATEGIECTSARMAINAVKEYEGNCGIWFSNGIYYVDKSQRVSSKKLALMISRRCNQISIYDWAKDNLIFC